MRKVDEWGEIGGGGEYKKKIEIVATNTIVSQPPEYQLTGTSTVHAKMMD